MGLTYDLYWSFRSPYSYLVTPRLVALEHEFDVTCNVRVVHPIAVRQPEFFDHNDPLWFSYFMRDVFRSAQFVDLPLRWPTPDPVYRDPATGKYPREQPHIHRLSRLGVAATELGRGLAFLDEVSRVIWGGQVVDWHQGDHLARAADRAGLELAQMDRAIATDPDRYEAIISQNQDAQRQGGHYGVPLMVFDGEPFFGQDRFDMLKWRMRRQGLQARGG
jgi:2-hydroxychromene-2-carboxylate isomerase